MSGKLATLTRLHRWRLDEERRGLAAAISELDRRETALRELEAEIATEQESARTGPADAGIDYGSYARLAAQRRASCHEAIATAGAEVSRRREAVQSRYRELRTFELAEESRCRRLAAEASRREQLALDEIALLARSRCTRVRGACSG
jgi:flagellar export protein FliJ